MSIKILCGTCGGDNVMRDAYAEWDVGAQDWILKNVFDQGYCDDCGGEASLTEEEIADGPRPRLTTAGLRLLHSGTKGAASARDGFSRIEESRTVPEALEALAFIDWLEESDRTCGWNLPEVYAEYRESLT